MPGYFTRSYNISVRTDHGLKLSLLSSNHFSSFHFFEVAIPDHVMDGMFDHFRWEAVQLLDKFTHRCLMANTETLLNDLFHFKDL
jgi:hypothetical protein